MADGEIEKPGQISKPRNKKNYKYCTQPLILQSTELSETFPHIQQKQPKSVTVNVLIKDFNLKCCIKACSVTRFFLPICS